MTKISVIKDNGIVTQIRLDYEDDESNIKNKKLVIDSKRFNVPVQFFYEKHYKKANKEIIHEYINNKFQASYETENLPYFKIKRGFGSNDELFHTEVIYLDQNGKPYMEYLEVITEHNTIDFWYRYLNSNGESSDIGYKSFETCYHDYTKSSSYN